MVNGTSRPLRSPLAHLATAGLLVVFAGCASKTGSVPESSASQPSARAATEPAAAGLAPAVELPNLHLGEGVATAGQPSLDALKQAKAQGYKLVINLRTAEEAGAEQAADVEALGLGYVSIPVAMEAGVTEANARALAAALAKPDARPAIVHCASANRAGALFALKAFYVDGKSAAESLELGKRLGLTKFEAYVRDQLAAAEAERARAK